MEVRVMKSDRQWVQGLFWEWWNKNILKLAFGDGCRTL